MATVYLRGDAQGRAQVTHFTPENVGVGDKFKLTINRKDIEVTATEATVANVVALLVAAVGEFQNDIPEFAEVSASAGEDADGNVTHLVLTGKSDGTPFTVTGSATNAGAGGFGVQVTVVQEASAGQNEIQRVRLPGNPSGGTFTLTYGGATSSAINYNDDNTQLTGVLEAISGIGDIVVTGGALDFTVEFNGSNAGANVPLFTANGSSLTGGASVTVTTTTNGSPGTNEQQAITIDETIDGSFTYRLTFSGQTTGFIGSGASAASIKLALEALSNIGAGNVAVSGPVSGVYTVTFQGALAYTDVAILTCIEVVLDAGGVLTANSGHITITEAVAGSSTDVNEVQVVTINNSPTGGTFTLTFQGQTTGGIAYNASAGTVQTALEALSNIAPGEATVTGSAGGPYTVTFSGTLGGTDLAQMTGNGSSLTGSAVIVSVVQEAVAAVNEVQRVRLTGNPTGGTFTLTLDGETTSGVAYDASAATLEAALVALATPGPSDIDVSGDDGGPWLVEFTGSCEGTDVELMTGSAASLTGANDQTFTKTDVTTPTGPHHLDEAENYSGGAIPSDSDILIIENIPTDFLYGLDGLDGITLAELHIRASYTGKIGLPQYNPAGYFEYRDGYATLKATKVFIGEGEGQGSPLLKLDLMDAQTELICYGTGQPDDRSLPALQVKGSHTSNVMRFFAGTWGIAVLAGDTAAVATLQVGYLNDQDSDTQGLVGSGADLAAVSIDGGETEINLGNAAAAIVVTGGEVIINGTAGTSSLRVSNEAVVYWNTTGTLGGTPVVSDNAELNFSQDMRAKTVTNPIEVYGNGRVIDPFQVVAGLVVDFNYREVDVNGSRLGSNVRVTRGTPA